MSRWARINGDAEATYHQAGGCGGCGTAARRQGKIKQLHNLVHHAGAGHGVMGGGYLGIIIGLILWMPWMGIALGAAAGGLAGKLIDDKFLDFGVDDKLIKEVGNTIEPGHSALFLLVTEAEADKVEEELKGAKATVLQTSLSAEQEAKLHDMFAVEDIEA